MQRTTSGNAARSIDIAVKHLVIGGGVVGTSTSLSAFREFEFALKCIWKLIKLIFSGRVECGC